MTAKQIAEATSKPERTVQGWAKKAGAKLASVGAKLASGGHGKPADYDLEETCAIIETGLGKNAADLYRMNARGVPAQQSNLTDKDLELIQKLTAGIVAAVMSNLDSRVQTIETRIDQRQALLPAPQIDPKTAVSKIVREHVAAAGGGYSEAWGELYKEFGYRTHTNPKLSAKNRGMTIIDYIEAEGQIETLLAVAVDLWQQAA